jgi:hypothetical protein
MERPGDQRIRRSGEIKKIIIPLIGLIVWMWATLSLAAKDLEMKGKELIFQRPPFSFALPSEFRLIHSFSQEYPEENSRTRAYFFVKERNKQVEEMLIVQVGDRTNPQAEAIRTPPLKPYTEKRMYLKDKKKKGALQIDYLLQLMAWSPDASSLEPIRKKGITIPSHWTMQGQFLFNYLGEHAVLVRYSKDVNTFGLKVSETGGTWDKGSISGNEKKVYEIFRKSFLEMLESIQIRNP